MSKVQTHQYMIFHAAQLGAEQNHLCDILSYYVGLVAEAMAVQLPSNKSGPVTTTKPKRCNFWRIPFFGHQGPSYQSLKDVDSPVKNKGSRTSAASENTDDVPLLKAGDPTKAKYKEKLNRHAASDDDEPFVPRPNARIKFQLPDSPVTSSEGSPRATQEPDGEPVTVPETEPASNAAAAGIISAPLPDPGAAAAAAGGIDVTIAANDLFPSTNPASANPDQTLI